VNRRGFLGAAAGFAFAPALAELTPAPKLPLPADGVIRTAFVLGDGFNVIDMSGPWEALQDAAVAHAGAAFDLFTVSTSRKPVTGSGGLVVVPRYAFGSAPQPHVVVIPAHTPTAQTLAWLRKVARRADLVMSVCTGAFVLAQTGLLDGKTATTHHQSYDAFAQMFPKVKLVRGRRFVEHGNLATAGGLTSGIDLALHVVDRYLGRAGAEATADYMEYESRAWVTTRSRAAAISGSSSSA
jgi:transcriptional regulator GlxA family with amidase domain